MKKVFLLQGKYVHYIVFAEDLLEVETELRKRYSWCRDLIIRLNMQQKTSTTTIPVFHLEWTQYNMNSYSNEKHETDLGVLLERGLEGEFLLATLQETYI